MKGNAIGAFKHGILNAHCGDLPRYRGNACPNWAIVSGEHQYAIAIHYMEQGKLDSGDIVLKKFFPITKDTDITSIYANMEMEIPKMFVEAINIISSGTASERQSDNPADSLRCYPRIPSDSIIDWNLPCEDIIRIIRAFCKPFQGAYTFYGNKKINILRARKKYFDCPSYVIPGQIIYVDKSEGKVGIAASDGVIEINEVCINGICQKATEVLTNTHIRLNYNLYEEIYQLRCRIEKIEERMAEND